jgi:hypothetical protein
VASCATPPPFAAARGARGTDPGEKVVPIRPLRLALRLVAVRRRITPPKELIALLAIAAFAPETGAQIYKCEDASGQPTYQEAPCDKRTSTQSTIVIEPPPSPPSPRKERVVPAEPPPRAERPDRDLAMLLLVKIGCDDELPGFTLRTRDGYANWRKQNLQQVLRIERSEGYRLSVVQYRLERALRPASATAAPTAAPEPTDKARTYADALCYGNVASALGLQVRP